MSKRLSPEARERIRAEAQAVRDKVMGNLSVPPVPAVQKVEPKSRPSRPQGTKKDAAAILKAFQAGKRVSAVAAEFNVHPTTVTRILKIHNVPLRYEYGVPRSETCAKGHSMADALEVKGGGRACRTCKRARDRKSAKARYHRKKSQA